jgi:hypothetical protein
MAPGCGTLNILTNTNKNNHAACLSCLLIVSYYKRHLLHSRMGFVAYVCGPSSAGSGRPNETVPEQVEVIRRYLVDIGARLTTTYRDDRPQLAPLSRQGIQGLVQWVQSEDGRGDAIVVSDARFLFSGSESDCGKLTLSVVHSELHFIREQVVVTPGTIGRHKELARLIRSSCLQHSYDASLRDKRKSQARRVCRNDAWYGYTKGADGDFIPCPKQLRTVHRVHDLALAGFTARGIAECLNKHRVPRPAHGARWTSNHIARILRRDRPRDLRVYACQAPEFQEWVRSRASTPWILEEKEEKQQGVA